MAKLFREDGTTEDVHPSDGVKFTLVELQTLVGGYIQIAPCIDPASLMVMDEDGKLKSKQINVLATRQYRWGHADPVVGTVVVGGRDELGG